jgi:hypothetical protein
VKSGKWAQATVERSLLMIPLSALALSIEPMIVILAAASCLTSFFIPGVLSLIVRTVALFVIMTADVLMAGSRIVGLFLSDND